MRKLNVKRKSICITVMLLLFVCIASLFSGIGEKAYAAVSDYSSVKDDLMKDENFDAWDYPENPKDYSINVIQIAESEDGELFIYTYQPCQKVIKLAATEVNMSFSDKLGSAGEFTSEADKPKLYPLKQVSKMGVFSKYVVGGVTVSKDNVRYYNITSLYRAYDKIVDNGSLKDENGIAVKVGQCWKAETVGGAVQYEVKKVDTITITGCTYGTFRVPEGFNFASSYARDMHVIAFSTDIKMDDLLEVDVDFKYRKVDESIYDDYYEGWKSKTVTVNYKEKGSSEDHIFGQGKKTWDRIQRSAEFIDTCSDFKLDMTYEVKRDIRAKDWVIAYWDTEYENETGGVLGSIFWLGAIIGAPYKHYTQVKDATVIRLEFLKDGKHYNLGAVSNKSDEYDVIGGGDETFIDNVEDFFKTFIDNVKDFFKNKVKDFFAMLPWWAWVLIGLFGLSIILSILSLIFPAVRTALKAVFFVIGKVFKAIWWIICLPFRGIAALFNRKSKKE